MLKRKQKSIIGGIACKFQFLKDHNKLHNMRSQCHESVTRHKQKISSAISQMENDSLQDLNCKFEEIALKDECRRTKYELQNALFTKFDVRKERNTEESNEDR